MKLINLIERNPVPVPWAEGEKIPWDDPEFSARMLAEHLTQDHDMASRRSEKINQHVRWIHEKVLDAHPARILDLGCGPGLYTSRLTRLGHNCHGIDFGPASIVYAKGQAGEQGLDILYTLGDLRKVEFGSGYDLATMIYGEFNVFRREEIAAILKKAHAALNPGGKLLLEPHTLDFVRQLGQAGTHWHTEESGLFMTTPHLFLQENFWREEEQVSTHRYFLVDAHSGKVTANSSSMQAYSNEQYIALLAACGFAQTVIYPGLAQEEGETRNGLLGILAVKA